MESKEVIDLTRPDAFTRDDLTAVKILLAGRTTVVEGTNFMPGRSGDVCHLAAVGFERDARDYVARRLTGVM